MRTNKRLNLVFGWTLFLVSFLLYLSTMAPTVSLWDCGEFIACMAKLEVGHPPGAPFYLLLGRFLTLFATDPSKVAFMANLLSVLASAGTVMLLYFSAHHILQRILKPAVDDVVSLLRTAVPSAIGALAFAVSDTFWFSAVEAEVYALSLFFTALCFWAILKWEECYTQKSGSFKWLVLIAYLTGLSVGVHLLNLLIIPVLVLLVLLQNKSFTWKLLGKSLLIGGAILIIILFGFIQNGLWIADKLELLFVNSWGLPFQTGLIAFVILLFGGLFFAVFHTAAKRHISHALSVVLLVFFIGYGSYAMIIIRASANTPINLNDPSNVFSFDSFMNREQYGDRPLLYGPYFNAKSKDLLYKVAYRPAGNRYETYKKADKYEYEDEGCGVFPRLHSSQPVHVYGYSHWAGVDPDSKERPSVFANIRFFLTYQINHMYFRYFMWNFAGRQNDEQGHGDLVKGNWISGISFIDETLVGNRDQMHSLEVKNASRNTYFLLPLLMGLVGIVFLIGAGKEGKKYLAVIGLLMIVTGPAIVLYLNQTPYEPRERDYAFVGSFYAFAIFIAIGTFALSNWIFQQTKSQLTTALVWVLLAVGLPGLMLSQNYNDHNRSGRSFALDMARSYLSGCAPNAILFTYGDNDTYPLWYIQEVEGYRTDVRVINYGLMGADWCIRQMYEPVNETPSMPLSIPKERYKNGELDNVLLMTKSQEFAHLKQVVKFIGSDHTESKLPLQNGEKIDYSPVNSFFLPADSGDTLLWRCPKNILYKNDIALLDLLATNNWERPVYFTIGADPAIFLGMDNYLRHEGLVYQLLPYSKSDGSGPFIETDVLYQSFMTNIQMGDANSAYYDHFCRRNFDIMKYRHTVNELLEQLIKDGQKEKAMKVIHKTNREMPVERMPEAEGNLVYIHLMHQAGEKAEAERLTGYMVDLHLNDLSWFIGLSQTDQNSMAMTFQQTIEQGKALIQLSDSFGSTTINKKLKVAYEQMGLSELK